MRVFIRLNAAASSLGAVKVRYTSCIAVSRSLGVLPSPTFKAHGVAERQRDERNASCLLSPLC